MQSLVTFSSSCRKHSHSFSELAEPWPVAVLGTRQETAKRASETMWSSPGSSRASPYDDDYDYDDYGDYDDDFEDGITYYPDEDVLGGFPYYVPRDLGGGSESNLEPEAAFGDEPPDERPAKGLLPLKELCSRFVGQNFPFGVVQLYPSPVPEDVQRRIAFWSFPTDEKKLLAYAKVMGGAIESDVECARETKVTGMVQTGESDMS